MVGEEEAEAEDLEAVDGVVFEKIVNGVDGESCVAEVCQELGEGGGVALEDGGGGGLAWDGFGGEEVEDEQGPMWFEEAMHFVGEGAFVFGVVGGFEGVGGVEGGVWEGGLEEGALEESDVFLVGSSLVVSGDVDLVWGEGEADE